MNTSCFEEQNRIDDLRIQRGLAGLDESQTRQLTGSGDHADGFNRFDGCIALVDIWLARDSAERLPDDQRNRLIETLAARLRPPQANPDQDFTMSAPATGIASAGQSRPRTRRTAAWFRAAALLSSAAACVFLASWMHFHRPANQDQADQVSVARLRENMLERPPVDMLHWVWSSGEHGTGQDTGQFWGDIIWSDMLQRGYALLDRNRLVPDTTLYQLRAFEVSDDERDPGVLCSEFRLDGGPTPLILMFHPAEPLSNPWRFSVTPARQETIVNSGPSVEEDMILVASAEAAGAGEKTGAGQSGSSGPLPAVERGAAF